MTDTTQRSFESFLDECMKDCKVTDGDRYSAHHNHKHLLHWFTEAALLFGDYRYEQGKQADKWISVETATKTIRSNFERWRKNELPDGPFSWHLQNNLLKIENEFPSPVNNNNG